jgi:hypothetical protein
LIGVHTSGPTGTPLNEKTTLFVGGMRMTEIGSGIAQHNINCKNKKPIANLASK